MLTQLPSVPSLIPSSFATRAIGRDVSIAIFTASSLNSGEKLFFGRDNYFTFPDGPSYLDGLSGRLGATSWRAACRHRFALVRLRPLKSLVLEPRAGYPPLLLRARVSVSCTDLGAPAARLSRGTR